ncbi:Protein YceI [Usitatibacter rugosus]|uniref:Protein YceI n=1 Tax=Usitatibacter rugosus TaxID=2732067 RepID=A0A6M4GZV4_9PROT|nr:YceI family protein [Usitatibacter rugosus]QJR12024.1 Protein YceI [Usitatibacter rugosus]
MQPARRNSLLAAALVAVAFPFAVAAAPTVYKVDSDHTFPSLEFNHMGISIWRGKFDRTSGTIVLDREKKTGTVDLAIDPASINFGLKSMYVHATGEDWFDIAKYPTATYKGAITFTGDKPTGVDGTLVFRGVTTKVPLTINLFGCVPHPMLKKEQCGADASGEVNWGQFGMKHSEYAKGDAGRVTLRIQVEAMKQD